MQQNLNVTEMVRNLTTKYNIKIIMMYPYKSLIVIIFLYLKKCESVDSGSLLNLVKRNGGVKVKSKNKIYAFSILRRGEKEERRYTPQIK